MIGRALETRLRDVLTRFPAVGLLGPRQSGKTTLAEAVGEQNGGPIYLDLELPSDRAKLSDPEAYFSQHRGHLVILDEIQRVPGIFQILRGIIDRQSRRGHKAGQFLLLGSASIDLLQQSAETLAGRIIYLELTPFTAAEIRSVGNDPIRQLWVRGGFPRSFLAADDAASFEWRLAFIQTYLERDIPALGPRIPAETLRRFWQMLANSQSQLLNAARIAGGLGVSGQTVARYLDIMTDLLLVRRLQPWASNGSKRLVRSPKVYVRDSGLLHALLGIRDDEQLLGHPVAGPSWEGFIIENVLAAVPPGTNAWFYRSAAGAEIDLLLDLGPKRLWAIEVKRSIGSPQPSKGFGIACEDVGANRRFVIYPGAERFRIDKHTEATPLLLMLDRGFG